MELEATVPEIVAGLCSLPFCIWYYMAKHWTANNALGLAFSIQGIEHLSLGSVQTGAILLSGLFFYDIFWVGTHHPRTHPESRLYLQIPVFHGWSVVQSSIFAGCL